MAKHLRWKHSTVYGTSEYSLRNVYSLKYCLQFKESVVQLQYNTTLVCGTDNRHHQTGFQRPFTKHRLSYWKLPLNTSCSATYSITPQYNIFIINYQKINLFYSEFFFQLSFSVSLRQKVTFIPLYFVNVQHFDNTCVNDLNNSLNGCISTENVSTNELTGHIFYV